MRRERAWLAALSFLVVLLMVIVWLAAQGIPQPETVESPLPTPALGTFETGELTAFGEFYKAVDE